MSLCAFHVIDEGTHELDIQGIIEMEAGISQGLLDQLQ